MPITQARDDDWFETVVPAHATGPLADETGAHVAQTIGPAADGCRTIVLTVDADAPSAGRDASILDGGLDTHWVVPERRDRRFGRATGTAPATEALAEDEPATSRVPRTARRPARERAAVRWSAQDVPLPRATAPVRTRARTEDVVVQGTWTTPADEAPVAFDVPALDARDDEPMPVAWFGETAASVERDAWEAEEAAAEAAATVEPAPQPEAERTTSSWFAASVAPAADLGDGPVTSTTPAVPAAPRRRPRPRRSTGTGLARRTSGPVGGVPGRRTVEIAGTPTIPSTPRLVAPERRRVTVHSPLASLAERPDRIALWAVLLGVFLILVAATSGHAAGL